MNERDTSPIGFFQKYLTVWVILCMAVGICIGKFLPQIPEFLNRFEYARVSIPMAILIWVDRQLAHQAFYHVRHGESVLLRGV